MARYPAPRPQEWVAPVRRGYRLACCDCGLVHELEFRLEKRNRGKWVRVQFRGRRNERSTSLMRRQNDFPCKPKRHRR